jgi:hypothetical protein
MQSRFLRFGQWYLDIAVTQASALFSSLAFT